MTESIRLTVDLVGDKYKATVEVTSTFLPADIFYYKNSGTTTLGHFAGVVDASQLVLYPKWTGAAVTTFAAPFVRTSEASDVFEDMATIDEWFAVLTGDIRKLRTVLQTAFPVVREVAL